MPKISLDGINMHYETSGRGDPLLIIHGAWEDTGVWLQQSQRLSEHFFVIRCDLRGHGETDTGNLSEFSTRLLADDLNTLLDNLKISKAHVVGFSFGGQVACMLAADSPQRISSLVLVGAPSRLPRRWRFGSFLARIIGLEQTVSLFASRFFYPPTEEKLQQLLKGVKRTGIGVTRTVGKSLGSFSVPMELATAPFPVLLVYGEKDGDIEQKEDFTRAIPALKLVVVKNAAHKVYIDRPEEFSQLILDFCANRSITRPALDVVSAPVA